MQNFFTAPSLTRRGAALLISIAVIATGLSACTSDAASVGGPTDGSIEAVSDPVDTNSSNVLTSGTRLAEITNPDDSQGAAAPQLSGLDQNGQRVTLVGDDTGRVLTFLSHWCDTCSDDLTALSDWRENATLPEATEAVVVSTASDPSQENYPPATWLDAWSGTTIMDDNFGTLAAAFGVTEVPATVAIKADGTILYRTTGVLDPAQLDEIVTAVAPGATEVPAFIAQAGPLLEFAPVEVSGTALSTLRTPDDAIGKPGPALSGVDPTGTAVNYESGDGTGRLMLFLAHWCPYCNQELPIISEYLANNDLPEGVEIVAVSTGQDETRDNWPPSEWFSSHDWNAPILVDDENQSAASTYGLPAFPFWAVVSPEGDVIYRQSGGLQPGQLEELIDAATPGSTHKLSFVKDNFERVTPAEADKIVESPPEGLKIIDLRQPAEIEKTGKIAGAENIDFYQEGFAEVIGKLDKTVPYLLYCETGERSGATIDYMAQQGFSKVYDLEGGIQAWTAAGLPVS